MSETLQDPENGQMGNARLEYENLGKEDGRSGRIGDKETARRMANAEDNWHGFDAETQAAVDKGIISQEFADKQMKGADELRAQDALDAKAKADRRKY